MNEVNELKARITQLESENEQLGTENIMLLERGQQAKEVLEYVRENAIESVSFSLKEHPADAPSDQALREISNIKAMTDISAIRSIARTNWGSAKQSDQPTTPRKTRFKGSNNL